MRGMEDFLMKSVFESKAFFPSCNSAELICPIAYILAKWERLSANVQNQSPSEIYPSRRGILALTVSLESALSF